MIKQFKGQWRFLSNFWMCDIEYNGIRYPSVEHGYQANKAVNRKDMIYISQLPTAGESKRYGGKITIRSDWEQIKLRIMEDLVRIKFTVHKDLKKKLLDTGDRKLAEGNYWGDTYWGIYNGKGHNHLGKILMKIREELRNYESNSNVL